MSALLVTFSLTPSGTLVAADDGATYRLPETGVGRPAVSWRLGSMPDSPDIHGTEYTSAAKEESSLPLEVKVFAASTAALDTACDALESALSQFEYTATVTEDGVSKVWSCAPADWSTGSVDAGESAAFLRTYTITIPVFPVPS